MSATRTQTQTQQNHKSIATRDVVQWVVTVAFAALATVTTLKINEAVMNQKHNDLTKQIEIQNKYFQSQLDKQDVRTEKIDEKLDIIQNGIHRIELQLKDKQDRKPQ